MASSLIGLSGCVKNSGDDPAGCVRVASPALAYKSNKTIFEVDDVTLKFYVGSENSGGRNPGFLDYPAVTYIYFANDDTMIPQYDSNGGLRVDNGEIHFQYEEGYKPENLLTKIETDPNFSVCKKMYNTDQDAFYKNNIVTLQYQGIPYEEGKFIEEELWGAGYDLYKISITYDLDGLLVPKTSYDLTIPSEMFTKDRGYLFFSVASYLTEEFSPPNAGAFPVGSLLESRTLALYYEKQGDKIVLSSYYKGE